KHRKFCCSSYTVTVKSLPENMSWAGSAAGRNPFSSLASVYCENPVARFQAASTIAPNSAAAGGFVEFAGAHILSVDQFERTNLERIFTVADNMAPYALREKVTRVLEGASLGNMFFEPTTRTR